MGAGMEAKLGDWCAARAHMLHRSKTASGDTAKLLVIIGVPTDDDPPDLRVRVSTMPFQPYASYFKPEELDTLTAAFNDTLQELRASGIDLSSEDKVALVKRKLAQRILVSATAGGVRDVETLKKQALRSLSGGVRPGGEQTFASEAA